MNSLADGDGFIFMKIGTHAGEGLEDIIARKLGEVDRAGFAMWGYGGNTCHPVTKVRPFAEDLAGAGQTIRLLMEPMVSKHYAPPVPADEFSVDGENWSPIDLSVHRVLGSRYALFIRDIRQEAMDLPLENTVVGIGQQEGRPGHRYVQGRVDKACLRFRQEGERSNAPDPSTTHAIGLVAELVPPYAALLRNR